MLPAAVNFKITCQTKKSRAIKVHEIAFDKMYK